MAGNLIGFITICICCIIMEGLGIYAFISKTPMNFWAGIETKKVSDIKGYNRAVAKLFCVYGMILLLLGLPLLAGQNSAWILLTVLGAMISSIVAMAVYSIVIERKYCCK